jgi:hypothetical protein
VYQDKGLQFKKLKKEMWSYHFNLAISNPILEQRVTKQTGARINPQIGNVLLVAIVREGMQ